MVVQPGRVVIGMDPHKRSVTIEVLSGDETVLGGGRFATGQGCKTDATDTHSIALVGTRMPGLRPVVNDEQPAVLRTLVDRRRSLGEEHTRMVSQLHHLLLELVPGGAEKSLSAAQAKAILAGIRPRDVAGKVRRRVAAELIGDLERIYRRKKADGKTSIEAMRCLKRRLSDLVYRTMLDDTAAHATGSRTGPGGHRGAPLTSSAAGPHPHTDTSDQPLPGPVAHEPRTVLPTAS